MSQPDRAAAAGSTLSALAHPEFRLLFSGLVLSNVSKWMQEFAIGWLIAQLAIRAGDPAIAGFYLGARSLASALPSLVSSLFAGVFADRMDRRKLLLVTRLASTLIATLLAIAVITDTATFPVVVILSAAAWGTFAFDPPVRQAMLPRIVPDRDLFSAIGLMRAGLQSARAIGPLIAGLLLVPFSMGGVMLVNAGLVLASVAVLIPMRPQAPEPGSSRTSVFGSLREGLAYVRQDDLMRWCAILQIAFAICAGSTVQLLPALAVSGLGVGAIELSALGAAFGIGSLAGAFFITRCATVRRRGLLLVGTMLLIGVLLVVLGLQRSLLGAVIVLAVLGFVQQLFLGLVSVILQVAAPDHLRGRVMSTQSMIFLTCMPIGVFLIGSLGAVIGVSIAMLLGGLVAIAMGGLILLRAPVIRELIASEVSTDRGGPAARGATGTPGATDEVRVIALADAD